MTENDSNEHLTPKKKKQLSSEDFIEKLTILTAKQEESNSNPKVNQIKLIIL